MDRKEIRLQRKDLGQEMENSLSYLFPVLLGFHGTHLWTNPEPGSFRKQVFLNVLGPLSHYPLSFPPVPLQHSQLGLHLRSEGPRAKHWQQSRREQPVPVMPIQTACPHLDKGKPEVLAALPPECAQEEEAPRDTQGGEDIGYMCGGDRDASWVWKSKYSISGFEEILRPCEF